MRIKIVAARVQNGDGVVVIINTDHSPRVTDPLTGDDTDRIADTDVAETVIAVIRIIIKICASLRDGEHSSDHQ
jgi:selenophosphate synthetase-related protein